MDFMKNMQPIKAHVSKLITTDKPHALCWHDEC